jgi:RimJ/RimL family protein N-acetyltransferase
VSAVAGRWVGPTIVGERVTLRPIPDATDAQDERVDLAIVEQVTGEQVGEAVLDGYDAEAESADLRIALHAPAGSGREVAAESARLLVDHGLRTLGLKRIDVRMPAGDGAEWVETTVHAARLEPDYPITTDRLLLRPLDDDGDVVAMHAYRSREDVCLYVPFVPGTLEEMRERFRNPERVRSVLDSEGQVLSLAIERRDTGVMIGDLVLFWHSVADGHAEVGYVIHPDHAGQGFATEATAALIDLAFDGGLPVHRVSARLDERHAASAAVCRRLGMRHEASYVEGEWFKGEWTTLLVFAVLEREWRALRNASDS